MLSQSLWFFMYVNSGEETGAVEVRGGRTGRVAHGCADDATIWELERAGCLRGWGFYTRFSNGVSVCRTKRKLRVSGREPREQRDNLEFQFGHGVPKRPPTPTDNYRQHRARTVITRYDDVTDEVSFFCVCSFNLTCQSTG